MIPIGKLAKLATGSITPDDLIEVVSSLGIEVVLSEIPEDRKADAFQRVAQFSLLPGAAVRHVTFIAKDGSRAEALFVMKVSDQSNTGSSKKMLDSGKQPTLVLSQSA